MNMINSIKVSPALYTFISKKHMRNNLAWLLLNLGLFWNFSEIYPTLRLRLKWAKNYSYVRCPADLRADGWDTTRNFHATSLYCAFSFPRRVVVIATAYGLDGPGIESRWDEIFRISPDRS